MEYIFELCILTCIAVSTVYGHGRLINPPGRSTMWKYGFNTPVNTDDHQLSCGGFGVQFYRNNGKCGICGDRYDGDRPNEAGGKYATGTIARAYNQGDVITVQIEITVNHGGWFQFKLCPNNDVKKRATQQCLDKYVLRQLDGSPKFVVPDGLGIVSIQLKLPQELTCSQCVFQWKWNTASNVRCDGSNCCRGCGPQEQFYGCSDISIAASSSPNKPPGYIKPVPTYPPYPATVNHIGSGAIPASFQPILPEFIGEPVTVSTVDKDCKGTREFRFSNAMADAWCQRNCANGFCPKEYCDDRCRETVPILPIINDCRAKQFWRDTYSVPDAADKWCAETCAKGHCPLEYCEGSCWARI